jgi:glycine cleavage system H protein
MLPNDMKYTKEHEWVKLDGDTVTMGITDHAQLQLGDITFVDLPAEERQIKQAESIATVESVKAASDVYSPVSGKISAVNGSLRDTPEVINQSPYEGGWICRISITDKTELDGLMDASAYGEYLKKGKE